MSRVVALWRRYWFAPAPLRDLAIARFVVLAIVVLLNRGGRARHVATVAPSLFTPIPFLAWIGLPRQPSTAVVHTVAVVETALVVLAALGILTRPALVGIFALQVVREAWINSLGKVTHATLPLLYALAFLALSPCDRTLSVRALVRGAPASPRSPDARWPIDLAFATLAAFYWKAGVAKLLDGGLAWADGSTLQFQLIASGIDRAMWIAERPALCRALATLVLVFELSAPLGMVRTLRPFVLAGGLCFHAGTTWFMGISFWPVVALYPMFVPWTALGTAALGRRPVAAITRAGPAPDP